MDKGFVPSQKRQCEPKETCGGEVSSSNSEEEMGEDQRLTSWGSFPHLCLLHVFQFLPKHDRWCAALVCHHWNNVMHSPSLWRSHIFHFNGRKSEYCPAVAYVHSMGHYLERLDVSVRPPRKTFAARTLEQTINGIFAELTIVRAPLRSLSLVSLELNRTTWTQGLRNALINGLTLFLHRGSSKLTSVCLNRMGLRMDQGLELLSALAHSQLLFPQCYNLELTGFFSRNERVYRNPYVPRVLRRLQGLTNLSLSYSCLSDELLLAFQHRQRGWRDVSHLQIFSLHCNLNEPHEQVVLGGSWATLVSSCPGLKVKLTVDQVINTDRLARILLPEMPLTEFTMEAFYSPEEDWSAKPVFHHMLPQYRHILQYLNLDLRNFFETLDTELLELVDMCECLEELTVWAFLEVSTLQRLLHIRLTKRSLLNKIRLRIYSLDEDLSEDEDQLEEILSSYPNLPIELDLFAEVCFFE